jgi:hypothetical protein
MRAEEIKHTLPEKNLFIATHLGEPKNIRLLCKKVVERLWFLDEVAKGVDIENDDGSCVGGQRNRSISAKAPA